MRVKIGPYCRYFGPHQLAELLCFWVKDVEDEYGVKDKPKWVHNFGEWLAHGNAPDESHLPRRQRIYQEQPETWLYKFLLWIYSKKTRKIDVHIDKWDTWSMDRTLASIILPMLKQIQASKQGAPFIDDEDVPDEIKSTNATSKEYDVDDNHDKRWKWVLDELIWTFEQFQPNYDWEEQYYSGEIDFYHEATETDKNGKPILYQLKEGPDHTYKSDEEGIKKHQERIDNGLRLFGKYYQSIYN